MLRYFGYCYRQDEVKNTDLILLIMVMIMMDMIMKMIMYYNL